jgi:CRP/FNR family nitrogen fixation transcriptional regulator
MLTQQTIRTASPAHSSGRSTPAVNLRSPGSPIEMMGAAMPFGRNVEIYGESEPAEFLYKVISGAVRTYKILTDGRRQIQAFHLPGDVFGFELENEHTLSAEAIVDSRVLVVKRSAIEAVAARDNNVARELWALTARELQRVQRHVTLLIQTAQERVITFLLEMADRAPSGNGVQLPMSRQDIADYLGVTIETVSRTLSNLETAAAIELPSSRRIILRDQNALSRLCN